MYKACCRFSILQKIPSNVAPFKRRTFFGLLQDDSRRSLKRLEKEANKSPTNALTQLNFIRELTKQHPEKAIQRIEDQRFATSPEIMKEYLKALVVTKKINHSDMSTVLKQLQAQLSQSELSSASTLHPYPATYNMFPPGSQAMASSNFSPSSTFPSATVQNLDVGRVKERPVFVSLVDENYFKNFARRFITAITALGALYLVSSLFIDGKTMGINSNRVKQVDSSKSDKTFDDVKGVDEAKQELEEIVEYLREPQKFTRLGGKLPKGVLLVGPPGTGKTLLARAIAGEANVSFFYASGSDFEEMYVGVGARRVRDLFESAKNQNAPCIIFIDEIDAIGGKRRQKEQQALKMTLNQLLVEMDGFGQSTGIIVIGATNVPESLDSALVRPGRFDRHVVVPLPDIGGRKQILEFYFRNIPKSKDVNLDVLARGTPGMSGAELMNVVNEAALRAAMLGADEVTMEILDHAKDKILMGRERRSAVISPESTRLTAFHEAGHALVALNTPGAMPVYKATVMPRGQALGMVSQLPDGDQTSVNKKEMLARIDVCMGGRAAEEIIYGPDNITGGASNDFMQATNVARNMVTTYGMNDRIGPVHHDGKSDTSPDTKRIIDEEVRKVLDASYARAKNILIQNRQNLEKLANALIQHETLSGEEIKDLLEGKKLKREVEKPADSINQSRKSKPPSIPSQRNRRVSSGSKKTVEDTK